jgi:hypothetical protein
MIYLLQILKRLNKKQRQEFVASQGKCGYAGYVEYQVLFNQGHWHCYKTDGYKLDLVATYAGSKGLKSVLNLVWNS